MHLIIKTIAFNIWSKSNFVSDVTAAFGVPDELHIMYNIYAAEEKSRLNHMRNTQIHNII